MAGLDLNIDRLKFDFSEKDKEQISQAPEHQSLTTFFSRVSSAFPKFIKRTTDPDDIPIEYNTGDYKLFVILRDYVQPHTAMTLREAVKLTLEINPGDVDVIDVTGVVFELAEQIPYHHPGQQKLARFIWSIGRSHERISRRGEKKHTAVHDYFQHMSMELADDWADPETTDDGFTPGRFVNYEAFKAHLLDVGCWVPSASHAMYTMRRAFDESHEDQPRQVQDAWILGAAQWILWNGQQLFKLVLCPEDVYEHGGAGKTRVPAESDNPEYINRITLEKWHVWKEKFTEACSSEKTGRECKYVAVRAVEMMSSVEKTMLF